jgi:hypothetical protein
VICVSWAISANLGRHERGVDARGWLWTITRGDTGQTLETDGRTELLKILDQDDPPRVIHCGITGCSYLSAAT